MSGSIFRHEIRRGLVGLPIPISFCFNMQMPQQLEDLIDSAEELRAAGRSRILFRSYHLCMLESRTADRCHSPDDPRHSALCACCCTDVVARCRRSATVCTRMLASRLAELPREPMAGTI